MIPTYIYLYYTQIYVRTYDGLTSDKINRELAINFISKYLYLATYYKLENPNAHIFKVHVFISIIRSDQPERRISRGRTRGVLLKYLK